MGDEYISKTWLKEYLIHCKQGFLYYILKHPNACLDQDGIIYLFDCLVENIAKHPGASINENLIVKLTIEEFQDN